jgi:hypothetical protein
MEDFKKFVELEEGLKPEHKMRPGWMIKADPVLKAKIEANKKKQKEMKALVGQKLKEDAEQIDELSSDTLQKYKTAAHKSVSNAAVKRHAGEMGSSEYRKNQDKRSKGINRADADKRLGTYKDKTPKKLDISGSANDIQKKYHSGSGGSRMSEEVKDKYDEGEYDREGDMAKSDLRSIIDNAQRLHDMIDDADNLPEWVQSKITLAEDYISTVANYLTSEMKEEVEQIDELSNDTLASYKKKAGESASEADKKGDFEKGHKRFKGIMKATFKQFANDSKK